MPNPAPFTRTLPARSIVILAVCLAPASRLGAQSVNVWREVTLPGQPRHVAMDTMGRATRVAVNVPQAWASLREGYQRLQIRTDLLDSAAGVMGNLHFVKSYNVGRITMSQAFDCGSGPSGPLADQARMHVAVVGFVSPAPGDSSDVRVSAISTAEHTDGSGRGVAWCVSSGAMENWLLDQIAPRSMRRRL